MMFLTSHGECKYHGHANDLLDIFRCSFHYYGSDLHVLSQSAQGRKLISPSFAALPLLMAYAGHTAIVISEPLIPYVAWRFWI